MESRGILDAAIFCDGIARAVAARALDVLLAVAVTSLSAGHEWRLDEGEVMELGHVATLGKNVLRGCGAAIDDANVALPYKWAGGS